MRRQASSCAGALRSISDGNYWRTPDQFDAFVSGIHSRFRSHNLAFQILGELRSDIFGTEAGSAGTFTGEATQGAERAWLHPLRVSSQWPVASSKNTKESKSRATVGLPMITQFVVYLPFGISSTPSWAFLPEGLADCLFWGFSPRKPTQGGPRRNSD